METKWFSQTQANGDVRHRLFKRNTKIGAWAETPFFVDAARYRYNYTCGERYGLYGSGMGELITRAKVPYHIAACFGGYNRLSDAKKKAEEMLRNKEQ